MARAPMSGDDAGIMDHPTFERRTVELLARDRARRERLPWPAAALLIAILALSSWGAIGLALMLLT